VYLSLTPADGGGYELRRVRFSKRLFTAEEAGAWWAEHAARVLEEHGIRMPSEDGVATLLSALQLAPAGDAHGANGIPFVDEGMRPAIAAQLLLRCGQWELPLVGGEGAAGALCAHTWRSNAGQAKVLPCLLSPSRDMRSGSSPLTCHRKPMPAGASLPAPPVQYSTVQWGPCTSWTCSPQWQGRC
jgi:hypothetical protein